MSYILDAIKKAESQRQQDHVPTLQSVISHQADSQSSISRNKLIGFAVLFVLLLLLVWFRLPIVQSFSFAGDKILSLFESDNLVDSEGDQQLSQQQVADQTTEQAPEQPPRQLKVQPVLSEVQKNKLQNIKLSVISYSSNPNKRFVMDGETLLREGDVIQGFKITEIEKNSILVEALGQNYRIKF